MAEVSTMNIDPAVTLTAEDPPPPDTVRFRRPPPRSFKESAPTPQAPGQYLGDLDIGPGLIGRHAELWWPDDSLWYLIEIQVRIQKLTSKMLLKFNSYHTTLTKCAAVSVGPGKYKVR